jgi:hypothetical protein
MKITDSNIEFYDELKNRRAGFEIAGMVAGAIVAPVILGYLNNKGIFPESVNVGHYVGLGLVGFNFGKIFGAGLGSLVNDLYVIRQSELSESTSDDDCDTANVKTRHLITRRYNPYAYLEDRFYNP